MNARGGMGFPPWGFLIWGGRLGRGGCIRSRDTATREEHVIIRAEGAATRDKLASRIGRREGPDRLTGATGAGDPGGREFYTVTP